MKRATASAKLLVRFTSSVIDRYNSLPEEERDNSTILGHLVRTRVPHESVTYADVGGMSCVSTPLHILSSFLSNIIPPDNNLLALLIAGHETTSNQTTWILAELARHPDVLQKGDPYILPVVHIDTCIYPITHQSQSFRFECSTTRARSRLS